ncbi:MAG: hypothetical protein ACW98K_06975 [Candidatus Kariarchaeaceae archaeon]
MNILPKNMSNNLIQFLSKEIPDMTRSKNAECLIAILKQAGRSLTTKEVLSTTKNFPKLCVGCSSGTHVISAGIELIEEGIVMKILGKGGYIWELMKKL